MAVCSFSGCLIGYLYYKKPITLQVPGKEPPLVFVDKSKPEKSILPSALRGRKVSASLTVEAALALPLFLFFALALMTPMSWLDQQRKEQLRLEAACEQLSLMAGRGEGEVSESENFKDQSKSELFGKEIICLEKSKAETIPFFGSLTGKVMIRSGSRRRAWVGLSGKLGKAEPSEEIGGQDEGPTVYVGANRGRYHLYRDCHYLSNDYRAIQAETARKEKNASGKYYKPCSRCVDSSGAEGTVYITPQGEHYHSDTGCSSMIAYVQRLPLKEAEHLGLCSHCAGRGG